MPRGVQNPAISKVCRAPARSAGSSLRLYFSVFFQQLIQQAIWEFSRILILPWPPIVLPSKSPDSAKHSHFNLLEVSRTDAIKNPVMILLCRSSVSQEGYSIFSSWVFCFTMVISDKVVLDEIIAPERRTSQASGARTRLSPLLGWSCAGESATLNLIRPLRTRVRPLQPRDAALDHRLAYPGGPKITLENVLLPSGKKNCIRGKQEKSLVAGYIFYIRRTPCIF